MENRPLAEYTTPELYEALRIAKEGRDNEMSPERACEYNARCLMISNEIAARNYKDCTFEFLKDSCESERRTYLGDTIEIDKSVDKSIDLNPNQGNNFPLWFVILWWWGWAFIFGGIIWVASVLADLAINS